ncbi:MAG: hypothetical protein VX876_02590 [Planctomycetota bacterium]|nr:hypothetical protein [Planctomycetota bacterium]
MEPPLYESASHQLSGVEKYAGGFSRQKRRELQHQFENGLQWLEQQPPAYDNALRAFASCMKTDPLGAVYTYEFLQTLEAGYEKGFYHHRWRQRRRNQKLVKRISALQQNEQWHEILQQAPEALYHNARSETLLLELAFAAQSLDAIQTQWTYLEFALKYFPNSAAVHVQIIHAFYHSGRYDDANDHMFNLLLRTDDSFLRKIVRGLPGIITEQFPGRESIHEITTLQASIKENHKQDRLWLELCAILEDLNLYGRTIETCQQASQALGNPTDWSQRVMDLRLQQAESRLNFHQQLDATDELLDDLQHEVWRVRIEYYQKLTAQHPARPLPAIQLGWCQIGTGNWYEAIKLFNEVRQSQEVSGTDILALLLGLGEAQQAVRRFEEAMETFTQLLDELSNPQSDRETLNEKLGNQIPGLQKKFFFERSCERIKTLATSMNKTRIYEKCRQLIEKSSVSTEN